MSRCLLALSGTQHARLLSHLLPADGREAAAILLCAFGHGMPPDLIVRDILMVPHEECRTRKPDQISWPGARLAEAQDWAEDEGLTLVLIHSHPGGYFDFSSVDNQSDAEVMRHLFAGWCGAAPAVLGSAILVPGGAIRARVHRPNGEREDMVVRIVGDDIRHFYADAGAFQRPPMAFGDAMRAELKRRCACVIGVSGTGSIVVEQCARMGFGEIILIDFDRIEPKNLNRILNATLADAEAGRLKVDMFAEAIRRYRADVDLWPIRDTILSREAVAAAARADILFSCVDSSEGRQIADLIAQAFLIPLIDMGVSIPTRRLPDGTPAIADAIGRIDYVQPSQSSLGSRGVYTPESLRAEYLARVAPDAHAAEQAAGYIKGAPQEAPAVIALNMRAASAAVIEYVARAFPFRHDPNSRYARTIFTLAEGEEEHVPEVHFDTFMAMTLGLGAVEPPLGLPSLGRPL